MPEAVSCRRQDTDDDSTVGDNVSSVVNNDTNDDSDSHGNNDDYGTCEKNQIELDVARVFEMLANDENPHDSDKILTKLTKVVRILMTSLKKKCHTTLMFCGRCMMISRSMKT